MRVSVLTEALWRFAPRRRPALPERIENWSLTSLQQRLAKTNGRLVKHARYHCLLLAESHLTKLLFGITLQRIAGSSFRRDSRSCGSRKSIQSQKVTEEYLTKADGQAVVSGAGLALGQTQPYPEPLAEPKRSIVLEPLERVYSVGYLGAKTEIPIR